MNNFVGMDVGSVEDVAQGFRAQAHHVGQLGVTIDGSVHHAMSVWSGSDSQFFAHSWQSRLRGQLAEVVEWLDGMASTLQANAKAQTLTSAGDLAIGARRPGTVPLPHDAMDLPVKGGPLHGDKGMDVGRHGIDVHADGFAGKQGAVAGHTNVHGVDAAGDAGASAGVAGNAHAHVGKNGLDADAGVRAGVDAHAHDHEKYGIVSRDDNGDAFAGAQADATGHLGRDGADLHGNAFAGAKAEGSSSVDVGGVTGKADVAGYAGIGANGDVGATSHDGVITIKAHLGVAVGLGGSVGGSVSINTHEIRDNLVHGADSVGHLVGRVW